MFTSRLMEWHLVKQTASTDLKSSQFLLKNSL